MELNKELLDEYESLGLDMLSYITRDGIKLRDLSDEVIKDIIDNLIYRLKKRNPLDVYEITKINTKLFIYNDIKNKKRIEKIKYIKDKIDGTKENIIR